MHHSQRYDKRAEGGGAAARVGFDHGRVYTGVVDMYIAKEIVC